jgi:hypothetical protein
MPHLPWVWRVRTCLVLKPLGKRRSKCPKLLSVEEPVAIVYLLFSQMHTWSLPAFVAMLLNRGPTTARSQSSLILNPNTPQQPSPNLSSIVRMDGKERVGDLSSYSSRKIKLPSVSKDPSVFRVRECDQRAYSEHTWFMDPLRNWQYPFYIHLSH